MTLQSPIPPDNDALIESLVNKLPPKAQEDARSLFKNFSSGIATLNQSTGNVAGSNTRNISAPPLATLAVSGSNGVFNGSITNPNMQPPSSLWHEVSYSTTKGFTGNVTTLPATQATTFQVNQPGSQFFFRIRSSINKQVFNDYSLASQSAISSGLVSSAATSEGGTFNQTNLGTVTSVATGSTAEVQIQGAGGSLTSLVALKGAKERILPPAAIVGVTPSTDQFVGYDGTNYVLRPTLGAVLADGNTPIGKVSVVGTGTPTLPTIVPIIAGGGVVGYNVTSQGNGITGPLTLVVSDPGGPGTGATTGAQTISAGKLLSVAPGNAGSLYDSHAIVTASGGIGPGTIGGGTAAAGNGGRMTNV